MRTLGDEQDWRKVLLEMILLVTTPAVALSNVVSIMSSSGLDRALFLAIVPTTLWSAAAIFCRTWPFWVRGAAMLSPIVAGALVVYVRVGFKGNASAFATVAVVLAGLLFGRRRMMVSIVVFSSFAVLVGTCMSLDVMPWQPLRLPEADRPSLWIRAISNAVLLWIIAGGAVTFVVERMERSLAARRRAMNALVRAQRAEVASQLAAGFAHDFNNLLNVFSVHSGVLLSDRVNNADRESARNAFDQALKRGKGLSRQLGDLVGSEERSITRFPLDRPIDVVVKILLRRLPDDIQIETETHLAPQIEADENEIQQILYNLILNARDAMPNGGTIHVSAGLETSPIPIRVIGGSLEAGRWATLTVMDSGAGIAPAIRDRIFDSFFTTKGSEGRTGLGLATVLGIAKASGGGVALETEAGRGATFKIYLRCVS